MYHVEKRAKGKKKKKNKPYYIAQADTTQTEAYSSKQHTCLQTRLEKDNKKERDNKLPRIQLHLRNTQDHISHSFLFISQSYMTYKNILRYIYSLGISYQINDVHKTLHNNFHKPTTSSLFLMFLSADRFVALCLYICSSLEIKSHLGNNFPISMFVSALAMLPV